MPAVFVHGVPDTQHLWDDVIARLERRDVVALSLPGFGCRAPGGFSASKEAYVDWLLGELDRVPQPLDLVAHDWGCLLTLRALSLRPRIARSWAAGSAPIDSEYVWHDVAQLWQTPEIGEQMMDAFTPDAVRDALAGVGVPPARATEAAQRVDATMKRSILALYRSAVNVGSE